MPSSTTGVSLAAALVTFAALAAPVFPAAASTSGCSTDTFLVKGTSLAVQLCAATAPAAHGKSSPVVSETLSARGQSLSRKISLDVLAPEEASHAIDDAPLQSLGIAGTLHMTIAYKAGVVHLEHALLVPGAIALK